MPRTPLAEALTLLSSLTAAAQAQTIETLDGPDLEWGSEALAISADGFWIAGLSWSNLEHQPVRWHGLGPREVLGEFVFSGANVRYVSNDGRVWGELDGVAGAWTSTQFAPLSDGYSRVGAPTPDGGMVILRRSLAGVGEGAFIYAGAVEVRRLLSSDARLILDCPGLSDDGSVGLLEINNRGAQPPTPFHQPALWTSSGIVDLPTPGAVYAEGYCLSASGRVAGGDLYLPEGTTPVIWIDAGAPIPVGPLEANRVKDLSADGRTALTHRGLWTAATGWRPFTEVLRAAGITPEDAAGISASAMSDNATVFAGIRSTPGRTQPVRLTLPPPCPLDYATDGFIDFFDYLAYVDCFLGDCPNYRSADFNADGFVDWADYADFVDAFEAGC